MGQFLYGSVCHGSSDPFIACSGNHTGSKVAIYCEHWGSEGRTSPAQSRGRAPGGGLGAKRSLWYAEEKLARTFSTIVGNDRRRLVSPREGGKGTAAWTRSWDSRKSDEKCEHIVGVGDEYDKDWKSIVGFLENPITNMMIYEEQKGQCAFTSVILSAKFVAFFLTFSASGADTVN